MTNKRRMRNAFIHAIADSLPTKIELTEENIKKIKENIAETDRRELCYVTYGLTPVMIPVLIISNVFIFAFSQSLPLTIIIADVIFSSLLTISFLHGKKKILEMGGCDDLVVMKNE